MGGARNMTVSSSLEAGPHMKTENPGNTRIGVLFGNMNANIQKNSLKSS